MYIWEITNPARPLRVQEVLGSTPRRAPLLVKDTLFSEFAGGALRYFTQYFICYFGQSVILRGEAVLLRSTAKVVHGHPLHVGAGLDVIGIRNQVREACEQEQSADETQQFKQTTNENRKHRPLLVRSLYLLRELF